MQNINEDSSKFYNHSSYGSLSFSNEKNFNSSFHLKMTQIIKLEDPRIHYRCPKCGNFPLIEFKKNQEDISYSCSCFKDKCIAIKELFNTENKYLTFINNDNENQNFKYDITDKFDNSGNYDNSNKSDKSKFEYFCSTCSKNICKDCFQSHESHDVINLELPMAEMNEKIELIKAKLNELKGTKEVSENFTLDEEKSIDSKNDNNNTIKYDIDDNGNYRRISKEDKKIIIDNFVELINIIINDYLKYPNFNHFFNIRNIYNILLMKE